MIKIKKGLDVPIEGEPVRTVISAPRSRSVALIGFDYVGMKPTMLVKEGDKVAKGQVLFEDKKTPGVQYTAPESGTVRAINRGAQRVFQSLIIDVQGDEEIVFDSYPEQPLAQLDRQQVIDNLVNSGLWTAIRTRPFSMVPAPDSKATALFINAMDTNPLAANPAWVLSEAMVAFKEGVEVLSVLTDKTFLCHDGTIEFPSFAADNIKQASFSGPHPAGLTGTHIHHLSPVSENKTAWSLNYQDVIAIGKLFRTGKLNTERVIALAGPVVEQPQLVKTQIGADLVELTAGKLAVGNNRIISGSVLSGRSAEDVFAFLGRYHLQVSALKEGNERPFMGWISPGKNRFSIMNIYLSQFNRAKKFPFTTNTNGSPRAMVPVGNYERVMPLDILPTQLLRALIVGDMDTAISLGALELEEEDLALCTYVCPGKYEFGPILRDNLTMIFKEG